MCISHQFQWEFWTEEGKVWNHDNINRSRQNWLWPSIQVSTQACEYSVNAWVKFSSACLYCFYAKIWQLFWRVAVLATCLLRRLLLLRRNPIWRTDLSWTMYNVFASCICIKNLKNLVCVLIGKSKPGPIFYWSSQIRTKISLADRNLVLTERRGWWKTSTAFFHYNTHGLQNEKHV